MTLIDWLFVACAIILLLLILLPKDRRLALTILAFAGVAFVIAMQPPQVDIAVRAVEAPQLAAAVILCALVIFGVYGFRMKEKKDEK